MDLDRFGAFWSATYVERETTPIDLVVLVERFCETEREPLTAAERASVDEILGKCQDEALRAPEPEIVESPTAFPSGPVPPTFVVIGIVWHYIDVK